VTSRREARENFFELLLDSWRMLEAGVRSGAKLRSRSEVQPSRRGQGEVSARKQKLEVYRPRPDIDQRSWSEVGVKVRANLRPCRARGPGPAKKLSTRFVLELFLDHRKSWLVLVQVEFGGVPTANPRTLTSEFFGLRVNSDETSRRHLNIARQFAGP